MKLQFDDDHIRDDLGLDEKTMNFPSIMKERAKMRMEKSKNNKTGKNKNFFEEQNHATLQYNKSRKKKKHLPPKTGVHTNFQHLMYVPCDKEVNL